MPSRQPIAPLFLLSLPRSGSTLVQRVLGAHSRVATAPEPWLLLPMMYGLRGEGVYAEYGHRLASDAIKDFCDRLPGGVSDYRRALAAMALTLYERAADDDATVFLDKTPRYALVVSELLDTFPESRFICLWRNPLAIVASLSASWAAGRWQPHLHKVDLYDGLERLAAAVAARPERFVTARYEDLVSEPSHGFRQLFEAVDLPWEPEVIHDFRELHLGGRVGDKTGTSRYDTVSSEPIDKWRQALASPVRVRWCQRYLGWIGAERLAIMGYDLVELQNQLDEVRPDWVKAVPDAVRSIRGVAYDLLEPRMMRRKLTGRPWRHVHHHD